jgi:hypothetical protein
MLRADFDMKSFEMHYNIGIQWSANSARPLMPGVISQGGLPSEGQT